MKKIIIATITIVIKRETIAYSALDLEEIIKIFNQVHSPYAVAKLSNIKCKNE